MPMPDPPLTIGLLGHTTTSCNLGIGALTLANMRILREAAARLGRELRFEIAAWREAAPPYVTGPDVTFHPLGRRFLLAPDGLRAMARRCDLVLDICGGDSFTDLYGAKRFLLQAAAQRVVSGTGTPLIFAPQTIGPFRRNWVRRAAAGRMAQAARVFARDRLSEDCVAGLGRSDIRLSPATDVAFHLPFDPPLPRRDGLTHVGINVSGLLYRGGYSGRNEFGLAMEYPALIRCLVGHFAGDPTCRVHLIAHVIIPDGTGEDDQTACAALAQDFPGVITEPASMDPVAAKSLIAGMDFFIGSRMHACIAALSTGVPVVPLAYSRKFAGLFGSLGYDQTVDCRNMGAEEVTAQTLRSFTAREDLSAGIARANARAARRIDRYRDQLVDELARLQPVEMPGAEAA